ncbi:hypothetical protein BCR39DRAFT_86241 [Naematelia encephala]|uniref:Dilute domain-containing protein n=1 Tax=Naematelia encephala TaxID=71784 RepID=A0A1Y2BAU5_9TREE|nr:hypothetical protein BCR39DRAFT_86241 [Naematelia encephala]
MALVPESPVVTSGIPSPHLRQFEPLSSKLHRSRSYSPHHSPPRFLSDPSPETLRPLLEQAEAGKRHDGNALRLALILRWAIRWAVEHGDVELIAWLVGLDGTWADLLTQEVKLMEDDDGWGVVGMAVQSSCGRQEMEEAVRAIVGRWGLSVGPRGGRSYTGWTPLHLASLVSTPPLISFLLTRGASPQALTNRGLTPLDLVAGMGDREDVCILLEHATTNGESSAQPDHPSLSQARQAMLARRRQHATKRIQRMERREKARRLAAERERWLRERARVVDVDVDLLLPPRSWKRYRDSTDSGLGWMSDSTEDSEVEDDNEEEDEGIGDADCSMLVFAPSHLSSIFEILITTYVPRCQPLASRTLPANVLFLYARFAHYRCDQSWLEELLEGAVERIEQGVYGHMDDLAYLAFWAYNTTVLLHLIRSDSGISAACEQLELMSMIEELINAIHVFVIRVAEQRIDVILDTALLDYEPLEDFNDVRFEGEWSLFRSFGTGRRKREMLPKASMIFSNGNSPGGPGDSPLKSAMRSQSIQDLRASAFPRSTSIDSIASSTIHGQSATGDEANPTSITEILSGVLTILQLYEVNPAITVQAFSQIFFWIACELFNRILTRKKYLCRSKAVQIRMNITALDDWVRANGLPAKTATKHLEPVLQLLQWLQCSSQIREFDTLIGTIQNMKAINPVQMRRAMREYRFEVNEGKMADECAQYLVQVQRDWERRRVQMSISEARRQASFSDNANDSSNIDALFDGTTALADFEPPTAPESLGELLDSRFMLPFLLPADNAYLVATPPADSAFQNIEPQSPFISDGSKSSRPPSRSSFSSSRPMGWAIPSATQIRQLPPDFFVWLRDRETERRRTRGVEPSQDEVVTRPPLGPSQRVNLPTRPSVDIGKLSTLPSVADDDRTPLATSQSYPSRSTGFPSPGLATSPSLEQLRERAKIPFEPVRELSHKRSESYELSIRSLPTPSSPLSVDIDGSRYKPRQPSSSTTPNGTDGNGRRWWPTGRIGSFGSGEMSRQAREGSEDTIHGIALEDLKTPVASEPGSSSARGDEGHFWGQ